MKKRFLIIIIIFLITSIICSCEKKEYQLIEITAEELVNNIMNEDKNFVFALYNEEEANATEFMSSLKNTVKNANINIYYMDFEHMNIEPAITLYSLETLGLDKNSYYVKQNNGIVLSEYYEDYGTMYKSLKSYAFSNTLDYISDKEKKNNLEEAKRLLSEGYVSKSYEKLGNAWTLTEAKEFYSENKVYEILDLWERYEFKDSELNKVDYHIMDFLINTNYYESATKSGEYENFDKTIDYDAYSKTYYYIKDNYIYTSKDEKKYTKKYYIQYLDKDDLHLKDLKNNKVYKYIKR